jgi:hypothetical protein
MTRKSPPSTVLRGLWERIILYLPVVLMGLLAGAMPLTVLEHVIGDYVAAKKA